MSELEQNIVNSQAGLKDIETIQQSLGQMITTKEDIKKFVEEPLIDASEKLWDLNIKTVTSSANSNDVARGHVYIGIDYPSLSEKNKEVSEDIGEHHVNNHSGDNVYLRVDVDENTTVGEISNRMSEIASKFEKQEPKWIPQYDMNDMKAIYAIPENEEIDAEEFVEAGFYYDADNNRFFHSQEHYNKVREFEDTST